MSKQIFILLSGLLLVGCGNFFDPEHLTIPNSQNNAIGTGATIDFAEVREKVFTPHCVTCHIQYGDYTFVKQDLTGIQSAILQNRMPKNAPPLSNALKQLLTQWIDEGAPENLNDTNNGDDNTEPEPVDELQANWESLYQRIFVPRCVVCHSPNGQAPWVDLSNRAAMAQTLIGQHINFEKPEESNLIFRLRHETLPMPPLPPTSNIPQLTPDEVKVVIEWIEQGLP